MDKNLIILVKKPSPQQMLVEDNVNKPDLIDENELMHYGIPGMKWYVRRYQNKDGTLTALGKARLATLRAKSPKMAKYFEVSVLENTESIKKAAAKKRKKSLKKAQKALKLKQLHESEAYKKKMAKKEAKAEAREKRKEERRLERKRLKEERRIERKEEKRRIREEQRAAQREEKRRENSNEDTVDPQIEKLKKKYIKMGPKAVSKHIDLYNYKELQNITSRYETQKKLGELRSSKGQRFQDDINRIIKYGNTVNNVINFLNSPGGKLIRKYMGDTSYKENVANFKQNNQNNNQNNQNNNQNNQSGMSNKELAEMIRKLNKELMDSNRSELEKEKKKRH